MLNEDDLLNRITTVKNLRDNCFKYLEESSKDLLTHKIIFTIAQLSSEKMGPVKLSEIGQSIFAAGEKSKQDLIRLTLEKSLLKCGMVEKLRYAANDVRYILTGYRFQKVKNIESFRGDRSEQVGDIFELPKSTWPISDEFYILQAKKSGIQEALTKINSDYDNEIIPRGKYEDLIGELTEKRNQINKKLDSKFAGLEELVMG